MSQIFSKSFILCIVVFTFGRENLSADSACRTRVADLPVRQLVKATSLRIVSHRFDKLSIGEVWEEYFKTRSEEAMNYLIVYYQPLLVYQAKFLISKFPPSFEIEDAISAGQTGLRDAIDKYNRKMKAKFETYAPRRIRGSILDEIRKLDTVPRLTRSRSTILETAKGNLRLRGADVVDPEILRAEVGRVIAEIREKHMAKSIAKFIRQNSRPPSESEIAEMLRKWGSGNRYDIEEILALSNVERTFSLSHRITDNEGDPDKSKSTENFIMTIDSAGRRLPGVLKEMQRRTVKELILKHFSRVDRLILVLYYYEGLSMREIGATLDKSESRVSQILTNLIEQLRSKVGFYQEDDLRIDD